jgi:phosphoglucomutase
VDVMIAQGDEHTPPPAISDAILTHNGGRKTGLADEVVCRRTKNGGHS